MNSSEIRSRYNTLSKAVDRIEQLENQLTQLRTVKPVAQAAIKPTNAAMPQRSLRQLQEALDQAHARGADPDEIKALYKELVKARGY